MKKIVDRASASMAAAWALLLALPALAQQGETGPEPFFNHYHHMTGGPGVWGGHFIGPIVMIIVIAAIIVLAVLAVRWINNGHVPGSFPSSPYKASQGRTSLDILKARYAKGEIDTKEYEERRRVLMDD